MKLKKRLSKLKASARSAKTPCELCGSFAPDGIPVLVGSDNPSVSVWHCRKCLQTALTGLPLQRDALLLGFIEAEHRRYADDFCKQRGFNRQKRRRVLARVEKDLPEILERIIQTAPQGIFKCLGPQGGES